MFDPFLGSGTTAVAAKQSGRIYIGCDISEEYCEIAEKRLELTESLSLNWLKLNKSESILQRKSF